MPAQHAHASAEASPHRAHSTRQLLLGNLSRPQCLTLMPLLQQKLLVKQKNFSEALELLRTIDGLERQEAEQHRKQLKQEGAKALQVGGWLPRLHSEQHKGGRSALQLVFESLR